MQKAAIQGIQGSFHHQVAQEYFGKNIELEECLSFRRLVKSVSSGAVDKAVMAIENSTAGSILPNYALIDEANLHIVGEHYIPIEMCFIALPGQRIEDITEVYSHPMALLQCQDFFNNYPHIKLIEDVDTAEVAKRIASQKLEKVGAVASRIAARLFDLEVLAEDIHSIKSNSTRFLILQRESLPSTDKSLNKASLKLEIKDRPGSLVELLTVIKENGLNMSKIQSLPIIDKPWEYAFFIDVLFENHSDFEEAMEGLKEHTLSVKNLGIYKSFEQ